MPEVLDELVINPVTGAASLAAGDSLGGLNSMPKTARYADGHALIFCVTVTDRSKAILAAPFIDLLFFEEAPGVGTIITDSSPLDVHDDDIHKMNGSIRVYDSEWLDLVSSAEATHFVEGDGLLISCEGTTTSKVAIRLGGAIASPPNGSVQVRFGVKEA